MGPTVSVTGVPAMRVPGSPALAVRKQAFTGFEKLTWYWPSTRSREDSAFEPRARLPLAFTTAKPAACDAAGASSAPAATAKPTGRRSERRGREMVEV